MITKQFDRNGNIEYVVGTRYQDCTEYSSYKTEAGAREGYRCREMMSRNLKPEQVRDPVIEDHTIDPTVQTNENNVLEWDHGQIRIAMDLAMKRLPAQANKTYRLKIVLEEASEGFLGGGI